MTAEAPIPYKQVGNAPAAETKTCAGYSRALTLDRFERGRNRCRECRRRDLRSREQRQAAEPARPAAIPAAELAERSRVDNRPPAPDLGAWLVAKGFAEREGDQLVPTALGFQVGSGLAGFGM